MTPDAIGQLKASYAGVAGTPRLLASRFYEELFAVAPNLRRLFPADLTSLQGHFEAALALVVRNLDEMNALTESLRDLGAQHVHWGARPEDYVTAREALVAAIRSLSPAWTSTLERDWRAAITAIVVPMLEGAAVHTALAAEHLRDDGDLTSEP
ncbi:MAG TPA: globin domain-containing protein [Vicinamibacterales bacterium]|jgi:hemoglobin-like flavoprotein